MAFTGTVTGRPGTLLTVTDLHGDFTAVHRPRPPPTHRVVMFTAIIVVWMVKLVLT
jgi:hypothetical protein